VKIQNGKCDKSVKIEVLVGSIINMAHQLTLRAGQAAKTLITKSRNEVHNNLIFLGIQYYELFSI